MTNVGILPSPCAIFCVLEAASPARVASVQFLVEDGNSAISCCTKAVLAALVVLFPVVSVTTVMFPPASLRATLLAVAAVAVSSFVTYLFELLGVPLVPARASYFGLSVMRATGSPAGVTSVLILPSTVVLALGCVLPLAIVDHAPP